MIRTRPILLMLGLFTLVGTPAAAQEADVASVSWLQGCWLAGEPGSGWEETWMAPRGGLMLATARSMREGRVTGFEFMRITETSDGLVFTASPSGQATTDFGAVVADGDLLRVENPQHDFPQKIEYHRVSADSITAKVFGEVDADSPAFQIRYGRASCGS